MTNLDTCVDKLELCFEATAFARDETVVRHDCLQAALSSHCKQSVKRRSMLTSNWKTAGVLATEKNM